jgi:hypothetical protein
MQVRTLAACLLVGAITLAVGAGAQTQDTLADLIRWQATKDAPETPNTPTPANGATNVQTLNASVNCISAGATKGVDVYLGTVNPPPLLAPLVLSCHLTPPALAPGTKYFWKVVAHNPKGTGTSLVWSFTTAATVDVPPPAIVCPVSVTQPATGDASLVNFPAPIVSGGTSPVSSSCAPASGAGFPVGLTNVSCRATDAIGRSASCVFPVTITPPAPPPLAMSCPSDFTGTTAGTIAYAMPLPTGGSSPVLTICNPGTGTPGKTGPNLVQCLARDQAGATVTCQFTVTLP